VLQTRTRRRYFYLVAPGTYPATLRITIQKKHAGAQSAHRVFVDDIDIIRRVKNGDAESFSLLVEKYHKRLLNFIYRLVGDEKIVEDLGQEVFLSVYKSLDRFDVLRGTPFSAWLFMSARNRCISELRKKRGRPHISIDDADDIAVQERSPVETMIDEDRLQAMHSALEQLPEPFKSAILQSLRGASLEKIATESGISVGTVKSRLSRAREKMRVLLSERFGGKDRERI
jgi:RNA polymerase sigma-70 factor, ECF subfamily